jgi:photosystem II stability/assembly factor-like uncharacterized protein
MARLNLTAIVAISMLLSCNKSSSSSGNDASSKDTLVAGWTMTTMPVQGFTNIFFVQNNGIAASTSAIFSSNNGGETWTRRLTYGNDALGTDYHSSRNIGMDSIGNVVIPQGLFSGDIAASRMLLSKDYINFNVVPDLFLIDDCWFGKNNNAYAVTATVQDTNIHFLKSIDGGTSWTSVSILPKAGNIIQTGVTRLAFVDSQTGWVSTPYGMFKTTNAGLSWTHLYAPPGIITNISAVDANICYVEFIANNVPQNQEIDQISKTTDGGASWQVVFNETTGFTPPLGPSIQTLQFVDANTGYLGRGQWIYKSTDGGVNWNKVVAIHSSFCGFTDLYFTDANHGWACSVQGQLLRFKQ